MKRLFCLKAKKKASVASPPRHCVKKSNTELRGRKVLCNQAMSGSAILKGVLCVGAVKGRNLHSLANILRMYQVVVFVPVLPVFLVYRIQYSSAQGSRKQPKSQPPPQRGSPRVLSRTGTAIHIHSFYFCAGWKTGQRRND